MPYNNIDTQILYVGISGFPIGYAQIQRQKLIAKGLIAEGCQVTVLSRYGVHWPNSSQNADFLNKDSYEGILFKFASGSPYVSNSFYKRNLLKLKGVFKEIIFILSNDSIKVRHIIISTNTFYNVLFYSVLSFLSGNKTVLDVVEFWSSQRAKKSIFTRIDNFLYDRYAFRLVNKVICISDFLYGRIKNKCPNKPLLKVPSIVDFSKFINYNNAFNKYYLFCGGAGYFEIIDFIITAYESLNVESHFLYLVAHGNNFDMERLRARIKGSAKENQIKIFSDLDYESLVSLYMSSEALLVPIRKTFQDFARFPNKIGEYCASGKPIISTNFGEVKTYFSDQINALLASDYDAKLFAGKMLEIVNNPTFCKELGKQSFLVGKKYFDHLVLGKDIYQFIYNYKLN